MLVEIEDNIGAEITGLNICITGSLSLRTLREGEWAP